MAPLMMKRWLQCSVLKDAIVVGHKVRYYDEKAILCFQLDEVAHRVIDTATSMAVNNLVPSEMGKSNSKLAELVSYLLGKDIRGTVHDLNIAGGVPSYQSCNGGGGSNEDQLALLYCH